MRKHQIQSILYISIKSNLPTEIRDLIVPYLARDPYSPELLKDIKNRKEIKEYIDSFRHPKLPTPTEEQKVLLEYIRYSYRTTKDCFDNYITEWEQNTFCFPKGLPIPDSEARFALGLNNWEEVPSFIGFLHYPNTLYFNKYLKNLPSVRTCWVN